MWGGVVGGGGGGGGRGWGGGGGGGGGPLLHSLIDLLGYPIPNPNPKSIDPQKGRRALYGVLVRVRARVRV